MVFSDYASVRWRLSSIGAQVSQVGCVGVVMIDDRGVS